MKKISTSNSCKVILRRLFNQHRIGGKHIPISICFRWIKHLKKDEHKIAVKDLYDCIKEGLVLKKPKPSDLHISLNPTRLQEIQQLIK